MKEIAVRVPEEIAQWVKQRPGSASETVLALAGNIYKQGQYITLRDPGAGASRVKLRLAPRVTQFVRKATKSRDTTAAVRKLLAWGAQGARLPSVRGPDSLPCSMASKPRLVPSARPSIPTTRKPSHISLARVYEQNPELARLSTYKSDGIEPALVTGDSIRSLPGPLAFPTTNGIPKLPAIVERGFAAIPDWALAIGIAVGPFAALYVIFRLIDWIALPAKAASSVAAIESATPEIAAWAPKAARGLGALL